MHNIKRYLIIVSFLAVLAAPSFASAVTVADLQAQINALLAQVQQLQAQLAQLQGQPAAWCYDFNRDLKFGNGGTDVYNLQIALEKEGFSIIQDEKNQKHFGESTADAVVGFQQKYKEEILTPLGLKYGTGYVGKATRAKLNQLYGCRAESLTQPAPTIPVISSITPISGPAGTKIEINGQGFQECRQVDRKGILETRCNLKDFKADFKRISDGAHKNLSISMDDQIASTDNKITGLSVPSQLLPAPSNIVMGETYYSFPTTPGEYTLTITFVKENSVVAKTFNFTVTE